MTAPPTPPASAAPYTPPAPPAPAPLAAVHAALAAAEREAGVDGAVAALLAGVRALGFDRALLVARDGRGEDAGLWTAGGGAPPAYGAPVWRRWLRLVDRRAAEGDPGAAPGWWCDLAADAWARAEFGELFGVEPAPHAPDAPGAPGLLLVAPPAAGDGLRVVLVARGPAAAAPGAPPSGEARQAAALLARAAASHLGRARLGALAAERAERLRRLHEAGVALARSLDEAEVVRELARQVAGLVPHDGLVVAHPDLEAGRVRTALRLVRGLSRPRSDQPLGDGPLARAARGGAPVRDGAYDAAAAGPGADDVVGDAGPAASVLAVPMLAGPRLVGVLAVHAARPGAYDDGDEELLRTVAAQAAVAVANARAFAESEAERRQSDALVALARAVGGSPRPGAVFREGLQHALALLGAGGAFVAAADGDYLHVVAGAGCAELLAGAHLARAGTLPGRAAAAAPDGEPPAPVVHNAVADAGLGAFPLHDVARVERMVAVPLVAADGVVGVVAVVNRAAPFTAADARVLGRLAELLAVAAVNARLLARAEEATREWRVAFDATGAGMVLLDPDGRVTRANVRAAELLAAAPDPARVAGAEFAAAACAAGDDPGPPFGGDAPAGAPGLRAALRAGARRRGRVRAAPGPDGRPRVFEVLVSPHPAGGAVATFDDVTARLALAERFRLVVETTRDALLITGPDLRVTYANPAALALFGRGPALVGAPVARLVRPDDRAAFEGAAAARRLRAPRRDELTVVRADGAERRVDVATAPLAELGAGAPASGLVVSARDLTDEREAQAAARVWTDRYARLVESASDGVVAVDADGRVTSANPAAGRAAGRPAARLVGRACAELVDPRDADALAALLGGALGGARTRGELRYRDRRGRPRVASVTAAPAPGPDGAPAAIAILRDVTGERRTAAQALRREKLAAMGELVSGVAHELNNPLAAVLALSELLLGEPVVAAPHDAPVVVGAAARAELHELAAGAHREARRAAGTVGRLLDFARQLAPRRAPADVNQLLVDALDRRRAALRAAGIDLRLDLDYELPRAWADAHQLAQAFDHLIANAEQALAGHDGPRELAVRTRAGAGGRVVAEVRDSGPGVPAADRARIFEPFFTTRPDGAGLGLAVAAGVVRDHGGELRVAAGAAAGAHDGAPGATFVVELPAAAAAGGR